MHCMSSRLNWILLIFSLLIVLALGNSCYHKNNSNYANYPNRIDLKSDISDEHLKKFSSSIKIVNGQAKSYYKLALFFQKRNKHKLSIAEFQKAISEDPNMVEAYNAMGISYDKLKEYDRAIICYKLALTVNPNLDYVYNNLGYSYLLKEDSNIAIEMFKKAIELNDTKIKFRNNLALAYRMEGTGNTDISPLDKISAQILKNENKSHLKEKNHHFLVESKMFEKNNNVIIKKGPNKIIATENILSKKILLKQNYSEIERKTLERQESIYNKIANFHRNTQEKISANGTEKINKKNISSKLVGTEVPAIKKEKKDAESNFYYGKSKNHAVIAGNRKVLDKRREQISLDPTSRSSVQTQYGDSDYIKTDSSHINANLSLAYMAEDIDTGEYITKVDIKVANGNGVIGSARRFGNYLATKGFNVTKIINSRSFGHLNTKLLYSSDRINDIQRILENIPCHVDRRNIIELKHLENSVKIIIGLDLTKINKNISPEYFAKKDINTKYLEN